MVSLDKKRLSERDICTKYITPAIEQAGWDKMSQFREEVSFTKGRVIVRGKTVRRGETKRADYLLFVKPNIPLGIIEANDNNHPVGAGMQQALDQQVGTILRHQLGYEVMLNHQGRTTYVGLGLRKRR